VVFQEEQYFEALSKDRSENADVLDKPALRGVKHSVVEKYSDQAHFIYELLQNADDAKATSARFVLERDKLVFAHNGTKHFTISNPETEESDTKNGLLGDINAITSIANSNKNEASIGKFGVGFKAVFQYTSTPHIFDKNIAFKIERFIVPKLLSNDYNGRNLDETLFVFPFDHQDRVAEEAYSDISEKLRTLRYPLLFLSNLKDITLEFPGYLGLYEKSVSQTHIGDTLVQQISLLQNDGDDFHEDKLWLFSRDNDNGNTYSVGFFADKDGYLKSETHTAFCFFPTKEVTNLNFIVHAPFLLTDSREGIKAGEQHNKNMIVLLSELAADSLNMLKQIGLDNGLQLIGDNFFDIIPYDEDLFSDVNDKSKISFKPFFTKIKKKLDTDEILPSFNDYATSENAYWSFYPQISEVFSNEQLAEITGDADAKWVFKELGRAETLRANRTLSSYIDSIIADWYDEDRIISALSPSFIENQSIEWLNKFYGWIAETNGRKKLIKSKAVFLNQDRKAISAFDSNGQSILFLPFEGSEGYDTVYSALMENEDTTEFLKDLGVSVPSLRDEVYNQILPQYCGSCNIESDKNLVHFKKMLKYYNECPRDEVGSYIKLIKSYSFIKGHSASSESVKLSMAHNLYFPNEKLKQYFSLKSDTEFVALVEYDILKNEIADELIMDFLTALGVANLPRIFEKEIDEQEALTIKNRWERSTWHKKWISRYIDGCEEILEEIVENNNKAFSFLLWDVLIDFFETNSRNKLDKNLMGTYEYFYRRELTQAFETKNITSLKTMPWIINSNGEFVSANDLTVQLLSDQYNMESDSVVELFRFLGIREEDDVLEESILTEEQQNKIALAQKLEDAGVSEDELDSFLKLRERKKQEPRVRDESSSDDKDDSGISENPNVNRLMREIAKKIDSSTNREHNKDNEIKESADMDEDEYIKPPVDFSDKIEKAKQRSEDEIKEILLLEELTQQAVECEKYTFLWFKTLLELEAINNGENNLSSREISISFAHVELETGTTRTLILKHPNRHIPQSMEDLADIPLELHFRNQQTKKVAIEVVNVKSYTLRVKLRTGVELEDIDLSLVTEAKIEAKNPGFLLGELKKQFFRLELEDEENMKENLCENIEFVFGPPGTGKTTHLANKVILPLMEREEELKVLVLTPTNKSADVLVSRIMESADNNRSYLNWLVRFGATNDNAIEESGVFRDKTFDIRTFPRNVTVTTIARFPYDYFFPNDTTRLHLSALKWDYIIIDEASMIPLVNIIYPLYKKTPDKFIIAGDPFQIEPITSIEQWKNENIYTMVELDSFVEPKTVPHPYHVELLTTQYRSIPCIGEIFSRFTYGGVLEHYRKTESQKPLLIEQSLDVKAINIIKFPVSKYESIYKPKRLQGKSNYQVYSALFTFEFVKYLAEQINLAQSNESFRIGIIAPYRTEADLIDKLLASEKIPKDIDIQVGTIHGFQGDECDAIISVFNPPPSISGHPDMFLNKKNIINVSISRARDYLFILMPDDNTENINRLTLVKQIEQLGKQQPYWIEYNTAEIEETIFGNASYLEDNSFSTSHQIVNVYGTPERCYEIRSEDSAVDIQIHNN